MSRSPRLSPRALRNRINASERAYYANIIREYPWPVSAILASSPASERSIDAAVRLSRRCERVAFDWLLEDIGWQPTPDEQGALLRQHAERVPLACVIQHAAWWADGLVSPPQDSGGAFELVVSGGASVTRPAGVAARARRRGYLDDKRLRAKTCRYG